MVIPKTILFLLNGFLPSLIQASNNDPVNVAPYFIEKLNALTSVNVDSFLSIYDEEVIEVTLQSFELFENYCNVDDCVEEKKKMEKIIAFVTHTHKYYPDINTKHVLFWLKELLLVVEGEEEDFQMLAQITYMKIIADSHEDDNFEFINAENADIGVLINDDGLLPYFKKISTITTNVSEKSMYEIFVKTIRTLRSFNVTKPDFTLLVALGLDGKDNKMGVLGEYPENFSDYGFIQSCIKILSNLGNIPKSRLNAYLTNFVYSYQNPETASIILDPFILDLQIQLCENETRKKLLSNISSNVAIFYRKQARVSLNEIISEFQDYTEMDGVQFLERLQSLNDEHVNVKILPKFLSFFSIFGGAEREDEAPGVYKLMEMLSNLENDDFDGATLRVIKYLVELVKDGAVEFGEGDLIGQSPKTITRLLEYENGLFLKHLQSQGQPCYNANPTRKIVDGKEIFLPMTATQCLGMLYKL